MKKWYNVEIPNCTRNNIQKAEDFKEWLYCQNFKFEVSVAGCMLHFEIYASENDVNYINNALDDIVYYDAIVQA